jgi:hypothetical protein
MSDERNEEKEVSESYSNLTRTLIGLECFCVGEASDDESVKVEASGA